MPKGIRDLRGTVVQEIGPLLSDVAVKVEGLTLPSVTPIVGEPVHLGLVDPAELPVRDVSITMTFTGGKLPKKVDHRRWQSAGSQQLDRGTCWAFAGIAATEAAYLRAGTTVRLSQEYLVHMVRSWTNQRDRSKHVTSLTDFQGAADIVQHLSRLNVPRLVGASYFNKDGLRKIWSEVTAKAGPVPTTTDGGAGPGPSDEIDWFEYDQAHIPLPARWDANWGVATYGTVKDKVDDLRAVLAAGHDIVLNVWDRAGKGGGHVILVYGYDDDAKSFLIKNSQTQDAFGTMKYRNDPRFAFGDDPANKRGPLPAYFVKTVKQPRRQTQAAWVGPWSMNIDGSRGRLVIRRYCDLWAEGSTLADAPGRALEIGTWYPEGGAAIAVRGWFGQDGQVLHCDIGGQSFVLSLFGWELDRAAGVARIGGVDYSTQLSRGLVCGGPGLPVTTRAYATAIWEFNHDGNLGTLNNGGTPAYVRAEDGARFLARVAGGKDHRFDIDIDWTNKGNSAQRFELLAHTRETGLAGGLTTLDKATYGLSARVAPSLYVIRTDGRLDQYRHLGRPRLSFDWETHQGVGVGWNGVRVVGGGDGVVYVVTPDGRLRWCWHRGRNSGTFDWMDIRDVGSGWQDVTNVLAGEGGLLYAIMKSGEMRWFRHIGRRTGVGTWEGPTTVAHFTPSTSRVITAGPDGVFYFIDVMGRLIWWRHLACADGRPIWAGPRVVAEGWGAVDTLIATGSGYLYARHATRPGDRESGDLWLHNHLGYLTGEKSWRKPAKVGTGWSDGVAGIFAT